MKSASPSSAQAQIGSSPGSGETVSVRLTGTKLASSQQVNDSTYQFAAYLLTRQHFLVFIEDLLAD